ncbi:MAG TPA: hypothetical protein QGF95_25380 [Candidatus Latescibacteria bacterium]|jgi:hypothetical protein|nr:hypothetical protein [Gemmatimonadaceae bacterium]MDP6016416.1 hypothetical protein [Candidatus Latescibacterota bacterium]HJP33899.1 hypothetical protein [Candidatus Latescibacterota bacterium]
MAETTAHSNPPPDDMHWGISYLREDIQDLRQDIRTIHARIDGTSESLTKRIDSRFALLLTAMIALNGLTIGAVFAAFQIYLPLR